jgi:hypothetical protein
MVLVSVMKVFLDDRREAPDASWTLVRTPAEAIALLESGEVTEISFDHDLDFEDGQELCGYDVLVWIEERVALHGFDPPRMSVHSANPPGHERLLRGIEAIERRVASRGR